MKNFNDEFQEFLNIPTETPKNENELLTFLFKNNFSKKALSGKLLFFYSLITIGTLFFWHQHTFGISLFGLSMDISQYFSFLGFYGLSFLNGLILSSIVFSLLPLLITKVEQFLLQKRFIFFNVFLNLIGGIFLNIFSGGNLFTLILWFLGALIGANYAQFLKSLFIKTK